MSQAPHYYQDAAPAAEFNPVRAVKDVGLTLGVVLLFGYAMAKLNWLVDPDADGRGLGMLLPGIAVLTLVASYGAQNRRRIVLYGAAAVIGILGLKLPSALAIGETRASKGLPLTAEERAAPALPADMSPEEKAARTLPDDRLCQEALGFSLAMPRDIFLLDAEAAALASRNLDKAVGENNLAWWSWSAGQWGQQITVAVARGAASSPEAFARFTTGIRTSLADAAGTTHDKEVLKTGSPPYSYHLEAARSDGLARDVYCVSSAAPGETSPAVCAITVAERHASLRRARESIQFGTCSYLLGPPPAFR